MENRIIIVGGMGPQASIELHRRIIQRAAKTGARDGGDFPYIVHLSLPIVDFISDPSTQQDALKRIVSALRPLNLRKEDKLVIACNTAHLLVPELERQLGRTFTSLIDATVAHARGRWYQACRYISVAYHHQNRFVQNAI